MTITANQQSEITADVRHPRTLVKTELNGSEIRLASGANITFDGEIYTKAGVHIDQIKVGKGGIQTFRVHFANENNIFTKAAINGDGFEAKPVTAWQFYGDTTTPVTEDVKLVAVGEVYVVPVLNSQKAVFDCGTVGGLTKQVPDYSLGPPDINHMPFSGQVVVVGLESYTIEIT